MSLSKEEELALIERAKAGDADARAQLFAVCLSTVWKAAQRTARGVMPIEDRFQYASIGVLEAIPTFDPKYEVRFVTHAYHNMQRVILDAARADWYIVKPKKRVVWRKWQRIEEDLIQLQQRPVQPIEVAEVLAPSPDKRARVLASYRAMTVRSVGGSDDEEDDAFPELAAPDEKNHVDLLDAARMAMAGLVDRERQIFMSLFGILQDRPLRMREVADIHNLTESRIYQIVTKSLEQLYQGSKYRKPIGLDPAEFPEDGAGRGFIRSYAGRTPGGATHPIQPLPVDARSGPRCSNCKVNRSRASGLCPPCYYYFKRTGVHRPERLWAPKASPA